MISAKSVRTNHAAQGNTCNPRAAMKLHHRTMEHNRVGGTTNLMKAIYAPATRKLCRIITQDVDTHEWRNGVMVRTSTTPQVSHTYVDAPTYIPIETLVKRADRLDMTVVEYCEYINYSGAL